MIENFVQDWWGQILGLICLVAWLNRQQTRMEVRIEMLEDKVKNLFALWNRHTDRLLDRKDK
jgi:ABC-type transporter Mla MlaB component|tara:strand:- start:265 stop:450 length:186 start_codon:yes stop_codon:yes gene_type:complete